MMEREPGQGARAQRRNVARRLLALGGVLMLTLAGASPPLPAQNYDIAPVPDLSAMLPESVLSSGQHRILSAAPDGAYRLSFDIESEALGSYKAESLPLAMVRIHEIQTLAQAISQYNNSNLREADENRGQIRIGGDSVADIITSPFSTSSKVVTQFGQNVGDTVGELGRFPGPGANNPAAGSTLRSTDPVLASHRRSTASQLNLDIYSSNPQVQRFLDAMARARMNGQTRAGITTVSLVRDTEVRIGGGQVQTNVRSAILNQEQAPLDVRNRLVMEEAGVTDETIEAFLSQPVLTPTHKTTLTEYLRFMDGVQQRGALALALLGAQDEVDALEGLQMARMYAHFHEVRAPIARFVASGRLPLALASDGTLVIALPFDVLAWDRETEQVFRALSKFAKRKNFTGRLVLVNGVATSRAKQQLAVLGFGTAEKYLFRS